MSRDAFESTAQMFAIGQKQLDELAAPSRKLKRKAGCQVVALILWTMLICFVARCAFVLITTALSYNDVLAQHTAANNATRIAARKLLRTCEEMYGCTHQSEQINCVLICRDANIDVHARSKAAAWAHFREHMGLFHVFGLCDPAHHERSCDDVLGMIEDWFGSIHQLTIWLWLITAIVFMIWVFPVVALAIGASRSIKESRQGKKAMEGSQQMTALGLAALAFARTAAPRTCSLDNSGQFTAVVDAPSSHDSGSPLSLPPPPPMVSNIFAQSSPGTLVKRARPSVDWLAAPAGEASFYRHEGDRLRQRMNAGAAPLEIDTS